MNLDFEGVFLGEQKELELTLRNTGAAQVILNQLEAPAAFTVIPSSVTIPGGGSSVVKFRFKPTVLGRVSGPFEFSASGAKDNRFSVEVEGIGLSRAFEVERTLLFGDVPIGEQKTLPLEINSNSEGDVVVSLSISGTAASEFTAATSEVVVPAGGTGSVDITFSPPRRDSFTAYANLRSCPTCDPVRVTLRGEGTEKSFSVTPREIDFDTVSPGGVKTRTVRVRNDGNTPLTIASARLQQDGTDFQFDPSAFPLALNPREAANVEVHFAPPANAALVRQENVLRFEAENGSEAQVDMVALPGGPHLNVNPDVIDFGTQPLNRAMTQVISITNVGQPAEVYVTSASAQGPGANRFQVEVAQSTSGNGAPVGGLGDVVNVKVTFSSNQPGSFAGQVEIHTTDEEQPLLIVPVQAQARQLPPCNLELRPNPLRFGMVPAGSVTTREITVTNVGDDECMIWDVELKLRRQDGSYSDDSSDFFSTAGVPTGTAVIPAGGILPLNVRFNAVSAPQDVLLTTGLRFAHSAVGAGYYYVPISAMATRYLPHVSPNPVRFSQTRQGFPATLNMVVTNLGAVSFRVTGASMAPGSAPDFGVSAVSGMNTPLSTSNDQAVFRVRYTPDAPGTDRGVIQINIEGVPEPLLVDVSGIGSDESCEEECQAPVVTCPAPIVTSVNNQVTLIGDAVDPTDDPVTCTWRVLSSPPGARAAPDNAAQCITTFTPDIVGEYVLELTATDHPMGNEASCTTSVRANPFGGLWIEMYWDRAGDMDLHLLHPDAGDPAVYSTWTDPQFACFYANCVSSRGTVREWDLPGPNDNPSLDRDDIPGTGPENIRINQPSTAHHYSAGFKNFSHSRTPVQVNYNIYCGGELSHGDVYTSNQVREFIWVGDITYRPTGGCSFRRENRVIPPPF